MLHYAIIILSLGAVCAAWVALQLWVQNRDPGVRTIFDRGCGGRGEDCDASDCGTPGTCTRTDSVPKPRVARE